jgi:hypothetical protein
MRFVVAGLSLLAQRVDSGDAVRAYKAVVR